MNWTIHLHVTSPAVITSSIGQRGYLRAVILFGGRVVDGAVISLDLTAAVAGRVMRAAGNLVGIRGGHGVAAG